jgi:hypothetical protein
MILEITGNIVFMSVNGNFATENLKSFVPEERGKRLGKILEDHMDMNTRLPFFKIPKMKSTTASVSGLAKTFHRNLISPSSTQG